MHAASEDVTQTLCRRRDMQTVVCRRDMLAKVCGHMVKREQSYDARSYFHQQLFDGRCAHETETMLFKIQSMQIHTIIIQPFISGEEGGGRGGGVLVQTRECTLARSKARPALLRTARRREGCSGGQAAQRASVRASQCHRQ